MSPKGLFCVILVALSVLLPSAEGTSVRTVMALGDTYVDALNPDAIFGSEPYLKVAATYSSICLIFLMFNLSGVSYVFNASSEVKVRLRCFNVTSPHVITVRLCPNNTWTEEYLTFNEASNFLRNAVESYTTVSSGEVWYEWEVTAIVRAAFVQGFDRLTLILEVASNQTGLDSVFFYSKDQRSLPAIDYGPQLVFAYIAPATDYLDISIKIIAATIVFGGIILVIYLYSRKRRKRKYKSHFQNKKLQEGQKHAIPRYQIQPLTCE